MQSLIIPNVDVGFTVRLVDDAKLFTTQTAARPRLIVDKIRLIVRFALIDQAITNRVESAILRTPFHIPFFSWVVKSYAVPVGSMEHSFDVSLRDNETHDLVLCTFHRNDCLIGDYTKNYQLLKRHDLIQSYLTAGLGIQIPSLPAAELSDIPGYNLVDESHQEMSYFVLLDSLGLIRNSGSPITMQTWLNSQFFLAYKTSFEHDRFSSAVSDRLLQSPMPSNSPTTLYVRFQNATTYVVRILLFFRCLRRLQLNHSREGFLSHVLEQ